MEVHVLPAALDALPDARLFDRARDGGTLGRQPLVEPNVGNHRDVAYHADVRTADGRVVLALDGAQAEIELVKRQTFDQVPMRLRLEAGEARIAQLAIGLPVSSGDAVE